MLGVWDNNSLQHLKSEYCMCMHLFVPAWARKNVRLEWIQFICLYPLTEIIHCILQDSLHFPKILRNLAALDLPSKISLEQHKRMRVGTRYTFMQQMLHGVLMYSQRKGTEPWFPWTQARASGASQKKEKILFYISILKTNEYLTIFVLCLPLPKPRSKKEQQIPGI